MRANSCFEATGVVLAGAAALGAYEAGVLAALVESVDRELGRDHLARIVSGTSAGAINAAAYAATIDDPVAGTAQLCRVWSGLRASEMLRPSASELLWMLVESGGGPAFVRRWMSLCGPRGALLDPDPIRRLLGRTLPLGRVEDQVRAGQVHGIAIGATHVATGRATVFYDSTPPIGPWPTAAAVDPVATSLDLDHVIASASIPLLFPPVEIAGELYCDGGLRQIVPLSPALHLGANRLIVVDPLPAYAPAGDVVGGMRREAMGSPLYLAGKAMAALFADRLDVDVARLAQISAIVRAGRRCYGPRFESELNEALLEDGAAPVRDVPVLRIEPSIDLGELAVAHALEPAFVGREHGPSARILRRLAEAGPTRAGDILALVMFDGGFATALVEQGRADAARRTDEILAFVAGVPFARAAAS